MDNNLNNLNEITETRWVDEHMARLDPPAGWQPNTERAFQQLAQRERTTRTHRWARISMAAALTAAAGAVLLLLPWQLFWNSLSEGKKETAPLKAASAQQFSPLVIERVTPPSPVMPEIIRPPEALSVNPVTHELLSEEEEFGKMLHSYELGGLVRQKKLTTKNFLASEKLPPEEYLSQQGITEPRVLSRVQPAYTEAAKGVRIQGTVNLLAIIHANGTVTVKEVTQGLGYGLDESAWAALEQWRFEPGTKNGQPVDVTTSVGIHFGLK